MLLNQPVLLILLVILSFSALYYISYEDYFQETLTRFRGFVKDNRFVHFTSVFIIKIYGNILM